MTDTASFARQAELELRNTRTISSSTCQAWEQLAGEARTVYARAMAFLGCQPSGTGATPSQSAPESDRVVAARLMLMKLGLATDDPRWSSDVLDRLLQAVMGAPGGSVGDLVCALFGVLGDYRPDLSNWRRMVESLGSNPTNAQLYLALHAIPPQFTPPQLADAIAKGLESTAFRDEAVSALAV